MVVQESMSMHASACFCQQDKDARLLFYEHIKMVVNTEKLIALSVNQSGSQSNNN